MLLNIFVDEEEEEQQDVPVVQKPEEKPKQAEKKSAPSSSTQEKRAIDNTVKQQPKGSVKKTGKEERAATNVIPVVSAHPKKKKKRDSESLQVQGEKRQKKDPERKQAPSPTPLSQPQAMEESEDEEPKPREQMNSKRATEDSKGPSEGSTAFAGLGLSDRLVEILLKEESEGGMGFRDPTAVQNRSIPSILAGRDVLIRSQTGSGKTLAFGLPILELLSKSKVSRGDGISALVLSPTRELCFQITQVLEKVSKPFHWIIVGSLVGGEKRKSEKARIRKGINILVATPGRLLDHLEHTEGLQSSLKRGKLRWLVLDEADRLTDPGFVKQISSVLDWLDENVNPGVKVDGGVTKSFLQTVLVSATLNSKVQELANRSLSDPVTIEVTGPLPTANNDDAGDNTAADEVVQEDGNVISMPKTLTQHFMVVDCKERLVALSAFVLRQVKRYRYSVKLIVFASCRAVVEFLQAVLSKLEWPPRKKGSKEKPRNPGLGTRWWMLHGSVEQKERKRAITEFSKARNGVLICTDVAARGLDLPHVDWIIQYDPPSEVSEYVHRVGRTARSGRNGSSLLFLLPSEVEYVDVLTARGIKLVEMKVDGTFAALSKYAVQEDDKEAENELDTLLGKGNNASSKGSKGKKNGALDRALYSPEAAKALLQMKLRDLVDGEEGSEQQSQEADGRNNQFRDRGKRPLTPAKSRLKVLAEEAFMAFVRAYAVHSKETKPIFHPKKLHLGHVARSFALKEEPKGVSSTSRKRHKERREKRAERNSKKDFLKKAKQLQRRSEFS